MNRPKILVVLTIILWSFGSYVLKLMSLSSEYLLITLSFVFTLITFLLYCIYEYKGSFISQIKQIKRSYLFYGLCGYFIYIVSFIKSIKSYNNASEATILNYTWPIFTIIFTYILMKDKPKKSTIQGIIEIIGIFFGFFAVVMIATHGNIFSFSINNIHGLVFGLAAGTSYGLFSAYSGTISKKNHPIFLFSSLLISIIFLLPFAVTEINLLQLITLKDIVIVVINGVLISGLGYVLWTRANRLAQEMKIDIASVASIAFVLPLLSLVVISIFAHETKLFEGYFFASLLFIIFSSILTQKSSSIENIFLQKIPPSRSLSKD